MRTPSTLILSLAALVLGTFVVAGSAAPPATTPADTSTRPAVTRPAVRPATHSALIKPKVPLKYTPATPEEIKDVEEWTTQEKGKVEEKLKIKLTVLETTHFRIMTDWDPREFPFLKDNFEAAYNAVSGQFNIPASENIFIGKLPCFIFVSYPNFERFCDMFKSKVSPGVQAIYCGNEAGFGFMVSHKPQADYSPRDHEDTIRMWKYIVTHEMTHAFVSRYISNRHVTTWLNEGIAEVIASSRFAHDIREEAQAAARRYKSLDKLFEDDDKFRDAELYPVMRTLTELLIKRDKKAFLKMFDDIKNGKTAAEALHDNYKLNYEQLEAQWRRYVGVSN